MNVGAAAVAWLGLGAVDSEKATLGADWRGDLTSSSNSAALRISVAKAWVPIGGRTW